MMIFRPKSRASAHCAECQLKRTRAGGSRDAGFRSQVPMVVALAGNPNTGKSTVFNALTGLRQHTGNWPGKTVARARGLLEYEGMTFHLVDLPGTYSLLSTAVDEEIARDFVLFGQPEVTVVVADSTRLERNLNLVLQILQITDRAILCCNLTDEARRRGVVVDAAALRRDLGIPVVLTAARSGEGLDELKRTIAGVAAGRIQTHPRKVQYPAELHAAIDELLPALDRALPGFPNAEWVAVRLLDGDEDIRRALESGKMDVLRQRFRDHRHGRIEPIEENHG